MTIRDAIEWFQTTFSKEVLTAVTGTPFPEDLVAAIAYQETGYIWKVLVEKGLKKDEVLRLCVGDTLDSDRGRNAFPKTKTALLAAKDGDKMFAIARQSLVDMAQYVGGYSGAVKNPNKFCHGFGIFQYDIQFFQNDPTFFLQQKWADITVCVCKLVKELGEAKARMGWAAKPTLTETELVYTAIAYNRGRADLSKDFRQGHQNDEGKFYGELIYSFLQIAKSIPNDAGTAPGGGPGLNIPKETPFVPLSTKKVPPYPGQLIKRDSKDKASVKLIQARLSELGYTQAKRSGGTEPLAADGDFGGNTADAVELFQVRHTNSHGAPLGVDGEVGSETWAALFGAGSVSSTDDKLVTSAFAAELLDTASKEVGVLEVPAGSNDGPRVREYQKTVGISAGDAWCVAFVFWCHQTAATALKVANPMAKDCRTGGVMDLWSRAISSGKKTVVSADAVNDPRKVKPGMVFIISTGGGHGHTGLVARVVGNQLETIEGNTNDGGSREGIGVFRRTARTIASINRGFIDFTA